MSEMTAKIAALLAVGEKKAKIAKTLGVSRSRVDQVAQPQKHRARVLLRCAVYSGRIMRPGFCEKCGRTCRPDGHHEDYARPLDVEWLCRSCHSKVTFRITGKARINMALRMTQREHARWSRAATALGETRSEFIRGAVNEMAAEIMERFGSLWESEDRQEKEKP